MYGMRRRTIQMCNESPWNAWHKIALKAYGQFEVLKLEKETRKTDLLRKYILGQERSRREEEKNGHPMFDFGVQWIDEHPCSSISATSQFCHRYELASKSQHVRNIWHLTLSFHYSLTSTASNQKLQARTTSHWVTSFSPSLDFLSVKTITIIGFQASACVKDGHESSSKWEYAVPTTHEW